MRAKIDELWPKGVPWGAKIMSVKNCNTFLVHHLAERDEIWHDKGHLCIVVLSYFGELWSTFA